MRVEADALATITRGEIEMQLDAAHRWPRSIATFMQECIYLATMSKETAKSCIYTLPLRKGQDPKDQIVGPSVRLAEMASSSWGNLHTGARILDEGPRTVTAQALCWDLEKNLKIAIEVKRGIVTKDGHRFGDDMIRVTSMAAISIALRNAIFRTIPRALVNEVYAQATRVATGAADDTFEQERTEIVEVFTKRWNIPLDRLLARLGVARYEDITQEILEVLIGLGQGIKHREYTIDEVFPPARPRSSAAPANDPLAAQAAAHAAKKASASTPPPANDAAPAEPANEEPPALTLQAVIDALVDADESWSQLTTATATAIVEAWSPEQQRKAYAWAIAFVQTPDDAAPPEQPEFTFIAPEPGSDG